VKNYVARSSISLRASCLTNQTNNDCLHFHVCVCVCACVRACVNACVRVKCFVTEKVIS
jgi:hypothetical protein